MPRAMDKMIKCLRQEHESMFKEGSGAMTVSHGEIHKCPGMTLNNSVHGCSLCV
jgi:hypothetical protein